MKISLVVMDIKYEPT